MINQNYTDENFCKVTQFFGYKLLKLLHEAVKSLTEKGILVNFFADTVHRLIYHQLCKIQRILCREHDFISN